MRGCTGNHLESPERFSSLVSFERCTARASAIGILGDIRHSRFKNLKLRIKFTEIPPFPIIQILKLATALSCCRQNVLTEEQHYKDKSGLHVR